MKIWLSLMLCGLMVFGQAVWTAKSLHARRIKTTVEVDENSDSGGDDEAVSSKRSSRKSSEDEDEAAPRGRTKKQASAWKHSWVDLAVFIDYSTVSMNDVNTKVIDRRNTWWNSNNGSSTVTDFGNALLFGGDLNCILPFGLGFGPRVEYLYLFPATGEYGHTGYGKGTVTWDADLLPLSIGLNYTLRLRMFSAMVGLYGGYGWASTRFQDTTIGMTPLDYSYNGTCTVITVPFSVRLNPPHFFIGLDLGYRYAYVSQMKASMDYNNYGIKKGDVMKDYQGNALPFDFSGINVGAIIGFDF